MPSYTLRHLKARVLNNGRYFYLDPPEVVATDPEHVLHLQARDAGFYLVNGPALLPPDL